MAVPAAEQARCHTGAEQRKRHGTKADTDCKEHTWHCSDFGWSQVKAACLGQCCSFQHSAAYLAAIQFGHGCAGLLRAHVSADCPWLICFACLALCFASTMVNLRKLQLDCSGEGCIAQIWSRHARFEIHFAACLWWTLQH